MKSVARSAELYERAKHSLAGGVGGNARSPERGFTPHPLFMERGTGAYIQDVDGNQYIDYMAAFGPLILGHRPAAVLDAVTAAINDGGMMFGFGHRLEIEAAEAVTELVPAWELVRFANTGTEAVLAALRMARGYTGRTKVLKFEGHYHGWADDIFFSTVSSLDQVGSEDHPTLVPGSEGIPEGFRDSLVVRQWNDPQVLRQTFDEVGSELAAVICEPVMTNCSVIPPADGYLQLLRDLTTRHGVVLIFDEVKTGFRVALGGAQELYGVVPDLSTAAKAIGGGFPVAAVGGRKELFDPVISNRVVHTATYHSNPGAMAACIATVSELRKPGVFAQLGKTSERLAKGLEAAALDRGIKAHVSAVGSLQQLVFTDEPAINFRTLARSVDPRTFRTFWTNMLTEGILLPPTQFQNYFVSTVHSDEDVDRTVSAAGIAFEKLAPTAPVQA